MEDKYTFTVSDEISPLPIRDCAFSLTPLAPVDNRAIAIELHRPVGESATDKRNMDVVTFTPGIMAVIPSNQCSVPLTTASAARAAVFYICKYLCKVLFIYVFTNNTE